MITIIIAVAVACGVYCAAYFAADWGIGRSCFTAILGFGAFQGVFGVLIQKRVKREMGSVQRILEAGQKRLKEKMQRWQLRPPSSMQAAQREMFEDTKIFVREALLATEALSKFRYWVPLIERQKATAQLQLNWMIKDFKKVDALMPKAIFMEQTMYAMKMARLYALGAKTEEIGKVYAKAVRRARYNQNVLAAATWSWILMQRNDVEGAFKALTEALKNSDNATLKQNHENLMNNRPGHFSNAGIGDSWYSLYLEEPKYRAPRQHNQFR